MLWPVLAWVGASVLGGGVAVSKSSLPERWKAWRARKAPPTEAKPAEVTIFPGKTDVQPVVMGGAAAAPAMTAASTIGTALAKARANMGLAPATKTPAVETFTSPPLLRPAIVPIESFGGTKGNVFEI